MSIAHCHVTSPAYLSQCLASILWCLPWHNSTAVISVEALPGARHDAVPSQRRSILVQAVQHSRRDTRQVRRQRLLAGRRVRQPDQRQDRQQVRCGLWRLTAGHPAESNDRQAAVSIKAAGLLQLI